MWLNTTLIHEKGYTLTEVLVLQLLKQNRTEEQGDYIAMYADDDMFEKFTEQELITTVKKKKKSDSDFSVLRLSKKGEKLLQSFTETNGAEEQDEIVFEWLKNLYLSQGKEIGSETKCKNLIAWFRKESSISKNNLILLCKKFTQDPDRMEYSKVLQYVFWKGENHFQTKPKLEDSKLWLYYEKYRDYFLKEFSNN